MHVMRSHQPFQLDILGVTELELTAGALTGYPSRQDDGLAEEVPALHDGFAGMETDAHPDGLPRMLEAVALALDLEALMGQPVVGRWRPALFAPLCHSLREVLR